MYKSLIDSLQNKQTFLSRTTPNIDNVLQETDHIIANELIPSLVKHHPYDSSHRKTFALPVKLGGPNVPQKNVLMITTDQRQYTRPFHMVTCLSVTVKIYQQQAIKKD